LGTLSIDKDYGLPNREESLSRAWAYRFPAMAQKMTSSIAKNPDFAVMIYGFL